MANPCISINDPSLSTMDLHGWSIHIHGGRGKKIGTLVIGKTAQVNLGELGDYSKIVLTMSSKQLDYIDF